MPRVTYHPGAETDQVATLDWYSSQSIEAAWRLLEDLERATDTIEADPERFPQVGLGCRVYNLQKFPVSIIFSIEPNSQLLIVAIAHAKREPEYWSNRVQ
ncbi:MAG: type II toxin-antitoxin system RelE/ParE family toxin [Pirellulaceae bacterium]